MPRHPWARVSATAGQAHRSPRPERDYPLAQHRIEACPASLTVGCRSGVSAVLKTRADVELGQARGELLALGVALFAALDRVMLE